MQRLLPRVAHWPYPQPLAQLGNRTKWYLPILPIFTTIFSISLANGVAVEQITDRVSHEYLLEPPPRPMPYGALFESMNAHLWRVGLRPLLDPVFIVANAALALALWLDLHPVVIWLCMALVLFRVGMGLTWLSLRVWSEISLLRYGLHTWAIITKLRPHTTPEGEIEGALLDVRIPVTQRRTYIGSLWLADGVEALRLRRQSQITVIALPTAPGTWRVTESVRCEVRYERMGRQVPIPEEA